MEWSCLTVLQQYLEVKGLCDFTCYVHVALQSLTPAMCLYFV